MGQGTKMLNIDKVEELLGKMSPKLRTGLTKLIKALPVEKVLKKFGPIKKLMNEQLASYQAALDTSSPLPKDDRKYLDRASMEFAITLAARGNAIAEQWARETLNFNTKPNICKHAK